MPKRFIMPSMNAFCVVSHVSNSHSQLKAQPVYRLNSPRIFVGSFVTSAACNLLHVSFDPEITIASTRTATISSTLPSTTMRNTHESDLHCSIPYSIMVFTYNPANCRPLCVRPYRDPFRRTIFPHMSPQPPGRFHLYLGAEFRMKKSLDHIHWQQPPEFS